MLRRVKTKMTHVYNYYLLHRGDSSQKARDLHVLEQLRNDLKKSQVTPNLDMLLEIKHAGIVNQALDLLLDCRHLDPEAFSASIRSIVDHYSQAEALGAESRLLLSRSQLLCRLLRLYIHLKEFKNSSIEGPMTIDQSDTSTQVRFSSISFALVSRTRLIIV